MPRTWNERKQSIANYRVNTVHTNKTGYAKLQGLFRIEFARWECGGPSPAGKPEKARIIEQGLDVMLQKLGIDPRKFLKDPDRIVQAKIDEIRAAAEAS
jgi:hypothetical protein